MKRDKFEYSDQDILDIVDNEGLGYAVSGYLGPKGDTFEDVALGRLWNEAEQAMSALQARLRRIEEE
jgi:hypothetical protein